MLSVVRRRAAIRYAAVLAVWPGFAPLAAAAAQAQPDGDTVLREVSLADLDLASAAGVATLHHRIDVAALNACQEATGSAVLGSPGLTDCSARSSKEAWGKAQIRIAATRNNAALASAGRP
jgi:UrcA family protein